MQNVEQVLASKRIETFTVTGVSPDVLYARIAAWSGLRSILGGEPEQWWRLKAVQYTLAIVAGPDGEDEHAVQYQAEFVRVPVEGEDEPEAEGA